MDSNHAIHMPHSPKPFELCAIKWTVQENVFCVWGYLHIQRLKTPYKQHEFLVFVYLSSFKNKSDANK